MGGENHIVLHALNMWCYRYAAEEVVGFLKFESRIVNSDKTWGTLFCGSLPHNFFLREKTPGCSKHPAQISGGWLV